MWKPRWFPNWRAWHPHPLQNPGTMWACSLSHPVQRRLVGVSMWSSAKIPPQVRKVLLTNDLTEPVLLEAVEEKVDMVISYHPPLFRPLKRLTKGNWKERVKRDSARIILYSLQFEGCCTLCWGKNCSVFTSHLMGRCQWRDQQLATWTLWLRPGWSLLGKLSTGREKGMEQRKRGKQRRERTKVQNVGVAEFLRQEIEQERKERKAGP